MEMIHLIDILLGVLFTAGAWYVNQTTQEVKRLNILLNKTREEYATKSELHNDIDRVMEALHRVEDKLDRVLTNK